MVRCDLLYLVENASAFKQIGEMSITCSRLLALLFDNLESTRIV